MLTLTVNEEEIFDETTNEFNTVGGFELELEHSLVSLSKWESKHQIPFLGKSDKTPEQLEDYIKFMILNPIYPENVIDQLSQEHFNRIRDYLESDQSATTFGEMPKSRGTGEVITSELIYYWMVAFTIPFEAERWHLNRLLALIRICNLKQNPPKKMSSAEVARRNRDLNERRRAQLGTRG